MLQNFTIVKTVFFVAKICKRALRASIEGYLAVSASTPTSATLNSTIIYVPVTIGTENAKSVFFVYKYQVEIVS